MQTYEYKNNKKLKSVTYNSSKLVVNYRKEKNVYVLDKKILSSNNTYEDFERNKTSGTYIEEIYFYDYEFENVQKIKYLKMGRELKAEKVKYNKEFWDSFKRPIFENF